MAVLELAHSTLRVAKGGTLTTNVTLNLRA